jgi:steroid 5-alpha reductase family enzyme
MTAPTTLAATIGVLIFMSVVMAAGWAYVKASRNAGWTDVFWTFGTGVAGVACALIPLAGQLWPSPRQGLVAILVALWALRLGFYIAPRVAHGPEDARYRRLREEWGETFDRRAFWFLQVQAPATALLVLSIMLAARRPFPAALRPADFAGLAILALAIVGETVADQQMRRFKADPAHHGKVIDTGLWAWSRHPNYFFEWLGWLAYPVMAIDLTGAYPQGWLALIGPAFMYLILTRLTGVPPLEDAMVRSKGETYRAYQARTSAFVPLPPRKRSAA